MVQTCNQTTIISELLLQLDPPHCIEPSDCYELLEALFFLIVLIGIIYLVVQYVIALVMSLYHFGFFSYGVMAEKAVEMCWLSK